MKDSTGKWISAVDMVKIAQSLPPNSRLYPNRVDNLTVVVEQGDSLVEIGMIDFMYNTYEPWSGEDEDTDES